MPQRGESALETYLSVYEEAGYWGLHYPGWPGDKHSYNYCEPQGVISSLHTQPAGAGGEEGEQEPRSRAGGRGPVPVPRKEEARFLRKARPLPQTASEVGNATVRSATPLRGTPHLRQEEPVASRGLLGCHHSWNVPRHHRTCG